MGDENNTNTDINNSSIPTSIIESDIKNKSEERNKNYQDLSQSRKPKNEKTSFNKTGYNEIDKAKEFLSKINYTNTSNLDMAQIIDVKIEEKYKGKIWCKMSVKDAIKKLVSSDLVFFACKNEQRAKSLISIIKDTKDIEGISKITNLQRKKAIELIMKSHNLE